MIDKNLIHRLAEVREEWCVSIYLSKEKQEKQYGLDQLRFNYSLAEAVKHLQARGMKKEEAESFIEPLHGLIDADLFFNRYQPGAVLIFLGPQTQETMDVPVLKEEMVYIGKEFYLRPVLSLLNAMQHYFLLAIDKDNALLFEGTQDSFAQIGNLIPLVEATAEMTAQRYEESGSGELYLRKLYEHLDKKTGELISEEKAPLILAGPDQRTQLFRELSSFPNILEKTIDYQADTDGRQALQNRVQPIVQEYFREQKKAKRRFFVREMLRGNASISLTDILAAAVDGRVATLFMDQDEFATGQYKPAIKHAEVDEQPDEDHTALFNLAAIHTFLKGGEVYDLPRQDIPDSTTPINATFRPE